MPQFWICGIIFLLTVGTTFELEYEHEGIYSNGIADGKLVIPRKVDQHGNHLSHLLDHYHDHQANESTLHYHLEIDNETLHLELEPSHESFIAPLMVVERHKRDTKVRKKYKHSNTSSCFYQGQIRGHHRSKVALSSCNGITGFVATKDKGFYWVEPSKKHKPHHRLGHPHVVFKTQDVNPHSASVPPKKRRKHRRRRTSTCGTKEPKRKAETRIEWQPQGKVLVQGGRRSRYRNLRRTKRSVSTPHHVEALVVADSTMMTFHEHGDVQTYLLTIMNMVSSLYKDHTIGNLVHIVVVKILLLDEEEAEEELNVSHAAEATLANFCRWQRKLNPKDDDDPHHHDVAILVTRKDICSHSGCMTLGVANVGGMCRMDKSCSVNEDNGITLAHTITHELGHNFGMYHDTEKTGCGHRIGSILHVMTPSFEADTTHVSWSNCSRRDITHFLDQGLGKCLDDTPTTEELEEKYEYPDLPPGAMYNADLQCRLQFNTTDETVRVCSQMDEICSQLWCQVDNSCITQLRAAAPGTTCGKHKWCQEQKCVLMEDLPRPVDGGWGNWSDWTECSTTCGAGVSIQMRECNNPHPSNGGTFCIGERTRYKTCNLDPCPDNEPSFRAVQCSKFNNETFRGKNYTWLPFFDTQEPCKLYCTDTDDTVIVPWGASAADGTPCNLGTNDMCISGICRKVGCDWVVDSETVEDQCGVCGGNGETCTVIKGDFNKRLNISEGYYQITTIPAWSRNIHVEEVGPSKNYLSIGKAGTEEFYLNGDRLIYFSGEYDIAGAKGLYDRNVDKDKEVLTIPGPIKEDIILYVLMKGKHKNVGLKYEYTLPSNATAPPIFRWKLGDWTACSATCGGGVHFRFPICFQDNKGIVDEELCWSNADDPRPNQIKEVCNEDMCPAHWWVGPWQLCPVTCVKRGDPNPVKRRSIMCVNEYEMALPDSSCNESERPSDTMPCGQVIPTCSESNEELEGEKVPNEETSNNVI
ncbi:A disintegrin and metalloproteinase with thrombospondin motifs 7 [Lutzomyia longipalpis]|uniref:A disintegrin and metalloproteinase with thrombospondin motifs 7 n=1 Tax=Lutzomyia longipalpis TaxID=7200 RepID=UPI00248366E0|nr:A disintegrin and metalloproteinase with thrombospondin motifs 7 [Lutzomyia longipalpis]XP_055689838.1 A disintegrin and metalloproteinase with thrombospondin motifs 7 [Lutzomyia longipalpis]